ncbi:MAG: NifB/NifX family molybdenum-iron cluster-binding protein [Bacilli bacterium]|jgi:predicted Fe-Mo cluster-binding NifX family protein|nr:NifB/NifX family molybdenum-iron cluster-binding protein [Bacilli bacterium]MDD2682316.1 NifB/NifX family molybdenum-iron cluster-binding protein [Bacilli bacterium]MDD3121099.1 NifB/NifX family molybdenum-iron cluster-binding protein [Bacilli bacterium]MDD4063406.1 NifB/NifX family molybdenum-iron cluster-binding protein [Bacilli bacterium]MDD4482348.1 NifB/NifX family molybdenum-iron cluster-binding protein [Bacilli bacterium]
MYKIAVACDHRYVHKHYSNCDMYKIFYVENNRITKIKKFKIKDILQDELPKVFSENNIKYLICGGIGDLARKLFCDNNIEIIMDISTKCRQAVLDFINEKLTISVLCSDINENKDNN